MVAIGAATLSDERGPPVSLRTVAGQSVALAERSAVQTWTDPDWQRFWLTVDKLPWRSLSLIPAGGGGPPELTLSLAVTLSRTGMSHVGGPIQVADGTQVPIQQLNAFLSDVRACTDAGERVIIALSAASSNPTTPAIAKSSDGVVLCVLLDRMLSADATQTIKLIGVSKFLGSVILRSDEPHHVK
jgi:hypothetical protein